MSDYIKKYGEKWPIDVNPINIEKYMYLKAPVEEKAQYLINMAKLAYTEDQLGWHSWTYKHFHIWCENEFATVWGPAATSKSNNFGCCALLDFLADPLNTVTFVCSTTKELLSKKIWEAILRYYNMLKPSGLPIILNKRPYGLVNINELDPENVKAGVFPISMKLTSPYGVHLPRVRVILDEMQDIDSEKVKDILYNLKSGTQDFKIIGMGNPESKMDALGEYSEPVDGWDSVDTETEEWKTKKGKTYFFNGMKSPAITEPDGEFKWPYLVNNDQVKEARASMVEGVDTIKFWKFIVGFLPPEGLSNTVLTESMITKYKMRESPEWLNDKYEMIGAVDPAFSSGGNRCVFVPAMLGYNKDRKMTIAFLKEVVIDIPARSEEPVIFYLRNRVIEMAKRYEIKKFNLSIEDSGTQSLADVLDGCETYDPQIKVHRCNFGGRASDYRVSAQNYRPAKEVYKNRVAELWFNMRSFAENGQIRGMSIDMCKEFVARCVEASRLIAIEGKDDMFHRCNYSPDIADAAVCILDFVRVKKGIHPGFGMIWNKDENEKVKDLMDELDFDRDKDNYKEAALC